MVQQLTCVRVGIKATIIITVCPHPTVWGHWALQLSVCLSVCPMPIAQLLCILRLWLLWLTNRKSPRWKSNPLVNVELAKTTTKPSVEPIRYVQPATLVPFDNTDWASWDIRQLLCELWTCSICMVHLIKLPSTAVEHICFAAIQTINCWLLNLANCIARLYMYMTVHLSHSAVIQWSLIPVVKTKLVLQ